MGNDEALKLVASLTALVRDNDLTSLEVGDIKITNHRAKRPEFKLEPEKPLPTDDELLLNPYHGL